MLTLFIIASVMAIFGVYGYRRGLFWSMAVAFGVLLFGILLITRAPEQLAKYFNAIYMATVLLLKGGLGAIAQGNLDSAKELLGAVEKPFSGEGAKWALFIVLVGSVVVGILLSLLIKPNPSVWGLIVGLLYGYVLSINAIRVVVGGSTEELFPQAAAATHGPCSGLLGRMICALNDPQSSAMCGTLILISVAVLVIVAVISASKFSKKG
jgi:F0F1-type ATP synthase assembly protein I